MTQTSNDGSLPLHCAVASGLSATVSALLATAPGTLLAKRVDGSVCDIYATSLLVVYFFAWVHTFMHCSYVCSADSLWIASQCGHDGIVRSLLLTGASPAGNEAAFAACENGNLSTLRVLFGSGVGAIACVLSVAYLDG